MQYKWVALSVTTVGTIMAGIDGRIVLVGMPTIANQIGAGVADVVWVSQAYLLASTIGLLFIGRTTDLVGRVKIYNYGFVVFTVGSALAALSFTSVELVISRLVQGVGSAMLITNASAILTDATPRQELGQILGISNVAYRVGSITGLTLSGLILSVADWRALFYINIPIGIFGTLWAHRRLREVSTKDIRGKIDWAGLVSFSAGLALLLLSITYLSYGFVGYEAGFVMLAAGVVLILFFIRFELTNRDTSPVLDPKLFKIKEFAAGSLAQMINALAWSGTVILVSFYLQLVKGDSPFVAGLHLLVFDAAFLVVGPISGRLSDKFGSRIFTTVGLAVSSISFFMFAFLNAASGSAQILLALALLGIGSGLFVSPNTSSVMGSVPANRRGIASAFRFTLLNVGDTVSYGLAILLMTIGIPYIVFNGLVQNLGSISSTLVTVQQEFMHGFQIATLVFALVNTIAIIPALSAKRRPPVVTNEIGKESSPPFSPDSNKNS